MDKAVWIGSEQARGAALHQFLELRDDSEKILAAAIVIMIGIFIEHGLNGFGGLALICF